jgi:Flp pilus assembly protein TadB
MTMNHLRLGLAICGFFLAVLAVALDELRLVWGAIAVLLGSLLLRLILRKRAEGNSNSED